MGSSKIWTRPQIIIRTCHLGPQILSVNPPPPLFFNWVPNSTTFLGGFPKELMLSLRALWTETYVFSLHLLVLIVALCSRGPSLLSAPWFAETIFAVHWIALVPSTKVGNFSFMTWTASISKKMLIGFQISWQFVVGIVICRNHRCGAWATAMRTSLMPKTIPISCGILSWGKIGDNLAENSNEYGLLPPILCGTLSWCNECLHCCAVGCQQHDLQKPSLWCRSSDSC